MSDDFEFVTEPGEVVEFLPYAEIWERYAPIVQRVFGENAFDVLSETIEGDRVRVVVQSNERVLWSAEMMGAPNRGASPIQAEDEEPLLSKLSQYIAGVMSWAEVVATGGLVGGTAKVMAEELLENPSDFLADALEDPQAILDAPGKAVRKALGVGKIVAWTVGGAAGLYFLIQLSRKRA